MMRYSDLIHCDEDELLSVMARIATEADREIAHEEADHVLLAAIHLAAAGELCPQTAYRLVESFLELDRWYA